MEVLRQIYESGPDFVSIPPELRRRRLEVIILPLEESAINNDVPDKEVMKFWGCIPDFPDIEAEGDYEVRAELP